MNDPNDDYNLNIEIFCDDIEVAIIKPSPVGPYLKWYASPKDFAVPVSWLLELLKTAQQRIVT